MFVDRDAELASLEELWGLRRQVVLLWGRRRVGKTTLLQRFAEGKPAIFYQADRGTPTEQLASLTARVLAHRVDRLLVDAPLANWNQALSYLLQLARQARQEGHPLLVVIDEYPYLAESDPALSSRIQVFLEDVRSEDLPLFLVLSGSQVGMFERHVLLGPLYGRRTWGEQLAPLGYRDAGAFFPEWNNQDRLRAYAVLGGIPYYLEQFDPERGLHWNLENRILRKGSVLYDEAELLIREELGSAAPTYLSIVAAIASGATRQADIASRIGQPSSSLPPYLAELRNLHILEHARPIAAASGSRAGIWKLADGYLRFWFRFVRANRTDLEARRFEAVFRERVRPQLDHFVSQPAFEEVCRNYVRRSSGVDPDLPARGEVGSWWGPVPDPSYPGTRRVAQAEADVVVLDQGRLLLAGECKWQREPAGLDTLAQLERTAPHIPGFDAEATRLAIFSREGFTDELRATATARSIVLRSADDLYAS